VPDPSAQAPTKPWARAIRLATGEEPVEIEGFLDLRDEGYGFVRVSGYLPSRDDVYVSVKQTRQLGLRKGDHITGLSRAAARNEKNPALLRIDTVNGDDPERARQRPRFEDLTPLFPDEKLTLENPAIPRTDAASSISSPSARDSAGIVSAQGRKTFVMKTIATSTSATNPESKLMVLSSTSDPKGHRHAAHRQGEVIASTSAEDEHTHVSELCIERAKRLVEMGADVVVILDGITRLARAYNLAAPATGRIMSGGIDAGALYPPKKFFGAARNIEEGGSLTILATALVETNSRMDDAIFEEFKGTGNMELRLDRKLAERRIYPAIDVDASSTRHEELLFDRKQLQMVWKLRRVLSGLAAEGSAAPGLELLIDRLKTFRTNDEFLAEIAKQPAF
jgi:transcription termination factor Rho